MRDLLVFGVIFAICAFIPKRPVIGVLAFAWLSLMNPHRLTYGAAFDFPFAMIVAILTLVSLLVSKEPKQLPRSPVIGILLVFFCWMTLTTFFAFEQTPAWNRWNQLLKTFLMLLVSMMVIRHEKDVKALAWVIGLSLGFWGLKGGFFTLTSGGAHRVLGPAGSDIADNNDLALALVMSLPIIWYLQMHAPKVWLRWAMIVLAIFTLVSAVGTYSRGALLAGSAMLFFLWLKSRQKIRTGLLLALAVPLVYLLMPEQWFERMESIGEYKQDASAMGRINAWYFAYNLALENLLGGGFNTFTSRMFMVYAPNPLDVHAAHSIYFRVLGEHGFIGLGIFLLLMAAAWRTGSRIIRYCKDKPDAKWAADLAAMCQVSIIGYAVGGSFLSLSYYDFYYYIIALLLLLEKCVVHAQGAEPGRQAVRQPVMPPPIADSRNGAGRT